MVINMFGYVRPYAPELKMKENELYRAIYCGLCREMGKVTGQTSRLSLNYDLAFLAAVRMLLTGETPEVKNVRCAAHPTKKRSVLCESESLKYSAAVSALLTGGKLDDDVMDEKGVKKLVSAALRPAAHHMVKKARRALAGCGSVEDSLTSSLAGLRGLEAAGEDSIDRCAGSFGELMAEVFAAGLDEKSARIGREIGRGVGRYVYVADAIDDASDDLKHGKFNPITAFYGKDALESSGKKMLVRRGIAEELMRATLIDLDRTAAALELICDGADPGLAAVVRNTVYLGMPRMMKDILDKKAVKTEIERDGK